VRKLVVVLVVLLIGGAFAAGFWLQREQLIAAQAETAELSRQLAEARARLNQSEAKARLYTLFADFLGLKDAVVSGNFGDAQDRSSAFFDLVRNEAGSTPDAQARAALSAILTRRDAVTAGLARGEASVRELLAPIERDLSQVFGYPTSPKDAGAAATPTP
jgi:hypothetical protein